MSSYYNEVRFIPVMGSAEDFDGADNLFETDQPLETTPTLTITLSPECGKFELCEVSHYMNPANAVTYQLYLFEDASADNVQTRHDMIYNSGANMAKGTIYKEMPNQDQLPAIVNCATPGTIYYMIDWSAAPGNTPGYIVVRGKML